MVNAGGRGAAARRRPAHPGPELTGDVKTVQNKLPKVVLVLIDFGKSAGPEALAGLVLHIQIFHAFILVFFNIFSILFD